MSCLIFDNLPCYWFHDLRGLLWLLQEYQTFGWWVGEKNGQIGIVPKDYLMELYAL